jgi:large subunit ribosomal protein L15
MPKLKGFTNARFKTEYNIINISDLVILSEKGIDKVDKEVLLQNNLIRKKIFPIKLL